MSGPQLPNRNQAADHQDPHFNDGRGPMPRIPPGYRMPSEKVRGRWIWPRDKDRGTWGRLKDLVTGKGPDIYWSRSDQFAPTKATWSNWTDPEYDNLGYRDEHDLLKTKSRANTKYDFRKRRYTKNYMASDVWSDVKWESGKNPEMPLYWRDAGGNEYTQRAGFIPAAWQSNRARVYAQYMNDFRYDPTTTGWDWTQPRNSWFWRSKIP